MRVYQYLGFGGAGATVQQAIIGGREHVRALYIDPASEIDACWIVSGAIGFMQGGLIAGQAQYSGGNAAKGGGNNLPSGAALLLSKEHPIIGTLEGPLSVLPFYRYDGTQETAYTPAVTAMLALRSYGDEDVNFPTAPMDRAVLRAGWCEIAAPPAGPLLVPTFGRKLLRLFADDPTGGNIQVEYIKAGFANRFNKATGFLGNATIAVPAGGGPPNTVGATFETTNLPDWMAFTISAGTVANLSVEVYD